MVQIATLTVDDGVNYATTLGKKKKEYNLTSEQSHIVDIIKQSYGNENEDFLDAVIEAAKHNKNEILAIRLADNVKSSMDASKRLKGYK